MNFETKTIMESLEKEGIKQQLCEKIMTRLSEESNVDYELLLDAVGRINAYARYSSEAEVSRLYYLLHSQNEKNNYGALRQVGLSNIPSWLLTVTRYLSVMVRETYLPEQLAEQPVGKTAEQPVEKTAEQPVEKTAEQPVDNTAGQLPETQAEIPEEEVTTPLSRYKTDFCFLDGLISCLSDEARAYLKSKL